MQQHCHNRTDVLAIRSSAAVARLCSTAVSFAASNRLLKNPKIASISSGPPTPFPAGPGAHSRCCSCPAPGRQHRDRNNSISAMQYAKSEGPRTHANSAVQQRTTPHTVSKCGPLSPAGSLTHIRGPPSPPSLVICVPAQEAANQADCSQKT